MQKTAQLIQEEIFNADTSFDGKFANECQEKSVPCALKTLINMIINVPNCIQWTDHKHSQAVFTISQIIDFNCKKTGTASTQTAKYVSGKHHFQSIWVEKCTLKQGKTAWWTCCISVGLAFHRHVSWGLQLILLMPHSNGLKQRELFVHPTWCQIN